MKIKNIKIGITTTREMLDEAKAVMETIQRGDHPQKSEGIYFENIQTMESVLTEKRLQLLRTIKEKKPKSIYELAKILKRDVKNINDDVNRLSELGFITLTKSKEGRVRVAPTVNYDKIVLEIPISGFKEKKYYKHA